MHEDEVSWLASFMGNFTGPAASILFSAGVGALAVINVFVAHAAMGKVKSALSEITVRRDNWRQDKDDLTIYREAESKHSEIDEAEQNHIVKDEDALKHEVAADVMLTITDALAPTLVTINDSLFMNKLSSALPKGALNVEKMQNAAEPIQAITAQTLIDAMTPKTPTN